MNEGIRIKPKSREKLQAQAEIFADKGIKKFSEDQEQLFKYSAELSKIADLNNLPSDLSPEAIALVQKHKDAYIQFLRDEKKLETDFIEENIKIYKEKFQVPIANLKARMTQGDVKQLPEYLGSGSNGAAFRVEVDGKTYAAKFSKSLTSSNFEIKALLRARGIPHTSQLVSYSFEEGVVVMELLPGTDVTKFTPEEAPEYNDAHIVRLIETVCALDERGLVIDPKPSNFTYDSEQGFSILDYHLKQSGGQTLAQQIMTLRQALTARKFEQLDYQAPDYKAQAAVRAVEWNRIFLPTMVKFLGILKQEYPEILGDWRRQFEEDRKNPKKYVPDLVSRESIPAIPEFEPHLKKLEEMGF